MSKRQFPCKAIVNSILDSFPDDEFILNLEQDHTWVIFPDKPLSDDSLVCRTELHDADELSALARVQEFVESLLKTDELPYQLVRTRNGNLCYRAQPWFKKDKLFYQLVQVLDTDYHCPLETRVFLTEVKAMQLDTLLMRETGNDAYLVTMNGVRHCKASLINLLVQRIRQVMQTSAMIRKRKEQREAIASNFWSNANYLRDLLIFYGRLGVGREDLAYRKEYSSSITLKQIRADLARLLKNRTSNKIFKKLVGYTARIEYGVEKGYHLHLILYFHDVKPNSVAYHMQQIGNYWCSEITKGKGCHYNCNMARNKYRQWCLDTLEYHDTDKIRILLRCIQYLCKLEQYPLHKKLADSIRKINHGNAPKAAKSPRGRPRLHDFDWDQVIAPFTGLHGKPKQYLEPGGAL